jgi:N4-gp56 family major capsid protein
VSLDSFIPQLWADTLLVALRKELVFANLANRDYEGQIKQMGDTVRISGIGSVTISNYVKDTDISAPQSLTDAQTMLNIANAKYYNFEVDDVDQAQQNPKVMTEAMSYAAYQLAETIDEFVAGFYTDAPAANTVGSSGSPQVISAPTDANIAGGTTLYDELVTLSQLLTQNNVPMTGRWAVVPPWGATYLALDLRFTSFNTAQAQQRLASGSVAGSGDYYLGMIAGMDVYQSNNAHHISGTAGAAGSQDVVLAGHRMALSFAQGLVKTEAYRPPYRFADAVKGLSLYGAKTVRPQAMAVAFIQHP